MSVKPKYSVIIPAKNGMPYLQYCVLSALASDSLRLEVIVSLDGSLDESEKFLSGIQDSRLRIVRPAPGLSMSEHWDFAQLQATGDWQLFVGQDDLLMNGYTDAFESLTNIATDRNLDIVVARRAYVAWPPLGDAKLKALQYWESSEIEVKDSNKFVAQALLSKISYHEGPQMYTTTLVSEKLISKIRESNSGKLVLGHPQDAYLAASLLKERRQFLYTGRPFSWVGSSVKSAGLAVISIKADIEVSELANDYLGSVKNSNDLSYKSSVDFRHAVNSRYFIDALAYVWPEILTTKTFRNTFFRIGMDSLAWSIFVKNRKPGIVASEMFYFPGLQWAKRIVGVFFLSGEATLSVLRRLAARILSRIRFSKMNFTSIDFVEDQDQLFKMAMAVRVSGTQAGGYKK
jgi:glycosyltransferase involved in cell wall biosynthesis